jgi:hypothetical protein
MSTGTNSNFPKARNADLITEQVGDELVVYDGKSSEAHCLSALAAAVFVAADGKTSTADLAAIASTRLSRAVDVPDVEQALAELDDRGLVEPIEVDGVSRRGFMQRSAVIGGAVVAGGLVTSVVTPAYGGTGSGGTFGAWSSLAVLFEYNGVYYGAHWSVGGPPTGNPPTNWGATEANANCQLSIPSGQTVSSGSISNVTATTGTNSITISVPAGVTIISVAAFFGQGGTGCHGCQHPAVSGSAPTYTLTFSC